MTPEDEAMLKSLTPEAFAKLAAKAAKRAAKRAASDKKHYEANKEKKAEYMKKWNEDNPDYMEKYYDTNKDKKAEYYKAHDKAYYDAHKKERAEHDKKYAHDHPEVVNAAHHNRRARLSGAGGSFTWEEFTALCEAYENVCVYCGEENIVNGEVRPLTADHIIAIANGGTGNIDNQYPACLHCNCSKHTKTFDEYMSTLPQEQQEEIEMRIYFAEHPEVREKMQEELKKEELNGRK